MGTGPTVTIGNVRTGEWHAGFEKITGGFDGIDPTLASVEVNGLPATVDTTDSSWEIDYDDILEDIGAQTPIHALSARLFEARFPGDRNPELVAVARVTFHDTSEYNMTQVHESHVQPNGIHARITQAMLTELANLASDEVEETHDLIEEGLLGLLDRHASDPDFVVDLGAAGVCSDMSALGLTFDVLRSAPGYKSSPRDAIPDFDVDGISDTVTVDESGTLSGVRVEVDIPHDASDDLTITLDHGGRSAALNPAEADEDGVDETFETTAFDGLDAAGDWTLTVVDGTSGNTGTLDHWVLNFTSCDGGECTATEDATGITADSLGISAMDFLGLTNLSAVQVCVRKINVDVTDVDASDFATGNDTDFDQDGEADPLVKIDAETGHLAVSVASGSITASADVTFILDITVDPLAFIGLSSPLEISLFDFPASCTVNPVIDGVYGEVVMDIEPGAEVDPALASPDCGGDARDPAILVRQDDELTHVDMGGFSAGGNGLCNVFDITAAILPVQTWMEDGLEQWLNGPAPCEPSDSEEGGCPCVDDDDLGCDGAVEGYLQTALGDMHITRTIPLEESPTSETPVIELTAPFDSITEDDNGVTFRMKTNARASTYCLEGGPSEVHHPDVDYQADSYHVTNPPSAYPRLAPMTPPAPPETYDFGVGVSAGLMTQALQAAYNLGVFHERVDELNYQSLGVCVRAPSGACLEGAQSITAGDLCVLVPQVCTLDSATELELHVGPRLAPVVVVDDVATGASLKLTAMHFEVSIVEPQPFPDDPIVYMTQVFDASALIEIDTQRPGEISVAMGNLRTGTELGYVDPGLDLRAGPVADELNDAWVLAFINLSIDVIHRMPLPQVSQTLLSDRVYEFQPSLLVSEANYNDETMYLALLISDGEAGCGSNLTVADCGVDPTCAWIPQDGGICIDASSPNCYALGQMACQNAIECNWLAHPVRPHLGRCVYARLP
ncbi:MAG: proprotein convertase P-domain-containing protein [Myxococcota bacterium]